MNPLFTLTTPDGPLTLTITLFVIGQVIATLELLATHREGQFGPSGLLPWRILRLDITQLLRSRLLQRLADGLFGARTVAGLCYVKLFCLAGLLFFPLKSVGFTLCAGGLIFSLFTLYVRQTYGGDGSDQMGFLLAVAILLGGSAFSTDTITRYALYFIAAQSCLAYCAAGVAKLVSVQWRSGRAVYAIFNTGSYGSAGAAMLLRQHPALSFLLSWSVIIVETLFPACLLGPPAVTFGFLFWGTTFHLLNALIMGLNVFLWMFLATYPALLFTAHQLGSF